MSFPVEIVFRGVDPSDDVVANVRAKAAELERFHHRILECKVVIEALHHHHRNGRIFHVRIELDVPGAEVAVTRDPSEAHQHEDVFVAIRDAFDAATRRLERSLDRRRDRTKIHEVPTHGRVVNLFPIEGYGFIEAVDGAQIYFHRNSVVEGSFDELEVGSLVRFVAREGESDKGPQASTVTPIGKHHLADAETSTS